MGDPKFSRSQWSAPSHPWVGERIKAENSLLRKYGLKNKREIWQAMGKLRHWRGQARQLQARIQRLDKQAEREKELLVAKLTRLGLLQEGATLDDVLALELDAVLQRRFQSLVYLKGMAKTTGHARQLISHGHFAIAGRKVTVPSYLLHRGEEDQISYYLSSPMNRSDHAMRPPAEFRGVLQDYKVDEEEQGGDSRFRRRVKVHVPVPVDQADETVGEESEEEKTKDITELTPTEGEEPEADAEEGKPAGPAGKPGEKPAAKGPEKPAAKPGDKPVAKKGKKEE
ncbi:MAG TPA: 30S ribosomal protein S4 [Candidatus Thermoplasmatota archaeon]